MCNVKKKEKNAPVFHFQRFGGVEKKLCYVWFMQIQWRLPHLLSSLYIYGNQTCSTQFGTNQNLFIITEYVCTCPFSPPVRGDIRPMLCTARWKITSNKSSPPFTGWCTVWSKWVFLQHISSCAAWWMLIGATSLHCYQTLALCYSTCNHRNSSALLEAQSYRKINKGSLFSLCLLAVVWLNARYGIEFKTWKHEL